MLAAGRITAHVARVNTSKAPRSRERDFELGDWLRARPQPAGLKCTVPMYLCSATNSVLRSEQEQNKSKVDPETRMDSHSNYQDKLSLVS